MSARLSDPPPRVRPMVEADLGEVLEVERRAYPYPWSPGIFANCTSSLRCSF